MSDVLPTGLRDFDRKIGDGLTPGSVIGIVTPPESQCEQLLRAIARNHDTFYVSTTRAAAAVEQWVTPKGDGDTAGVEVYYAGGDSLRPRGGDAVRTWLSNATGEIELGNGGNGQHPGAEHQVETVLREVTTRSEEVIVIDPVNPLENAEESRYTTFLHEVQNHLLQSDNIAILHMVETSEPPKCRWLSLQMADEIWDMSVRTPNERVEFVLTVTKSRNGDVPNRQIKFHLDDGVNIDTSRDIA